MQCDLGRVVLRPRLHRPPLRGCCRRIVGRVLEAYRVTHPRRTRRLLGYMDGWRGSGERQPGGGRRRGWCVESGPLQRVVAWRAVLLERADADRLRRHRISGLEPHAVAALGDKELEMRAVAHRHIGHALVGTELERHGVAGGDRHVHDLVGIERDVANARIAVLGGLRDLQGKGRQRQQNGNGDNLLHGVVPCRPLLSDGSGSGPG
jgi:hypothetical protein